MKLRVTPFEHQQEFIRFSLKNDYTLLGDEMGLGKTLSSIGVSVAMATGHTMHSGNPSGCRTLVVCPAFLRHNWRAEIDKFVEGNEGMFEVVSYSQLKKPAVRDAFKIADHVIFDESHYLKNLESQRTRYAHEYIRANTPERLTLLTGTAIKNNVVEFYSLLKLLSYCPSHRNGKSIYPRFRTSGQFGRHFSNEIVRKINVRGRKVEIRKFEGVKNGEELKSYFRGKYMRRLTKQVINLPELMDKYVECNYKFNDKELANYEKFKGKIEGHIMAIKRGSAMAKANFTADYAKGIFEEVGRPVVIFSDHVDPVHTITSKLKRAASITGSTPMSERHTIVQDFQSGKLDYLVATIGAASTGITLTASSDLVFNDMSYVPADNAQASKRIHRIGQGNICRIHKIVGSAVDRSVMESLQSKQQVIDKVL